MKARAASLPLDVCVQRPCHQEPLSIPLAPLASARRPGAGLRRLLNVARNLNTSSNTGLGWSEAGARRVRTGLLLQISLVNSPERAEMVNTESLCSLDGSAMSFREEGSRALCQECVGTWGSFGQAGLSGWGARWAMSTSHREITAKAPPAQRCLPSTRHVPGPALDAGDIGTKQTKACLIELTCWGDMENKTEN